MAAPGNRARLIWAWAPRTVVWAGVVVIYWTSSCPALSGLCLLLCAAGCAEGVPVEPAALGASPAANTMAPPSMTGEGAGDDGAAGAAAPVFDGEACSQGHEEACTCDDGGTGTRRCIYDPSSPLDGRLSDCERCVAPMDDTMMDGADAPDSDGSGGSAGSGGSGSGSSGGSGSSSGSGSSTPPPAPSGSGGSQPWCIFVPIPLPGLC